MKKVALLVFVLLSALSLSVPTDLAFGGTKVRKQVVQGKAKYVKNKKVVAKVKRKKVKNVVYKKPRYARNVNKPIEGELLKLEGMVKDLNE